MTTRMNPYSDRPGQLAGTSDGSRTITIHDVPTREEGSGPDQGNGEGSSNQQAGVLRLRGGGNTRRVVWTDETIDNEGMGKKKSKICCIYHKPKAFDESSDESSGSASSSDSDSESALSDTSASSHASVDSGVNASKSMREKKAKGKRNKRRECHNDDGHNHHRSGTVQSRSRGSTTMVETKVEVQDQEPNLKKPTPNAYERGFS